MVPIPKGSAAALATLILLLSGITLAFGFAVPQHHGVLFWLVTFGFSLQALASAAWLARLIASAGDNATKRGTGAPAQD